MVMRGDGGATDLAGFRRAPARTLYSGPAASVAGALRSNRIDDGVIVEVGGTSTNVAAIRHGRPGPVVRAGRQPCDRDPRPRRARARSGGRLDAALATQSGLRRRPAVCAHRRACRTRASSKRRAFEGATAELVAPRPGDPADHLVVRLADGRAVALTNTCAANALGIVRAGRLRRGRPRRRPCRVRRRRSTRFDLPPEEVARRMLQASTQAVGDLVVAR